MKNGKRQLKVKICGITTEEEIGWLNEYQPDYAGFVLFFPKSKRNLELERAKELLRGLSDSVAPVAVTVSPTEEQIRQIEEAGFSYVQIHGEVADEVIERARLPVWKAFNVTDMELFSRYNEMAYVKGFVLDAATPGSGTVFDWELLQKIPKTDKQKMLAGGITPANVKDAMAIPTIDGIDTSSGVEKDSGVGKDKEKMREFIHAVKEW